MVIEDHHSKRREFLLGVCISSLTTITGCIGSEDRLDTENNHPTETNDRVVGDDQPTSETERTDRAEVESCSTPDSTVRVLVADLIVQNTDDADHTVSITIRRDSATAFDESFRVTANGGGTEFTRSIFETTGTYNLVVSVANGSTVQSSPQLEKTYTILVDTEYWRRYNGVMVSIKESNY